MKKYHDVVLDERGNAVAQVQVTVYLQGTNTLATIYSDNGVTTKLNPFTGDDDGEFYFYAANGRYDIKIEGGTIDTEIKTDRLLFDVADSSIEDFSGITGTGASVDDMAVWDGTKYVPKNPLEANHGTYFARVNARTDGYVWVRRNIIGDSAVLDITQQGSGRIINFRQGTDDGVVKAYITNPGGAHFDDVLDVAGTGTSTFAGSVTITSNLTVNGTTTQVNSTEVNIGDNIIVLNSGETGTPTQNAGIEIERGTSANTTLLWLENRDRWGWTDDGLTWYDIPGLQKADTWTAQQTFSAKTLLDGGARIGKGDFAINDSDGTGNVHAWFQTEGTNRALIYWDRTNERMELRTYAADGSSVQCQIRLGSAGIDASGELLFGVAAPTGGTHVGDRDYNDGRYGQLSVSNTWSGTQVYSGEIQLNNGGTDTNAVKWIDPVNNTQAMVDMYNETWRIVKYYRGGVGDEALSFNLANDVLSIQGNEVWHQGNVGARINALTADATPDGAADYVVTYDASAGAAKKVLLNDLPGGSGGGIDPAGDTMTGPLAFSGNTGVEGRILAGDNRIFLQAGLDSLDTTAHMVIARHSTATTPINAFDVYATTSTFNGALTVTGDIEAGGTYLIGDAKRIVQYSDLWLRLNPSGHFSSGIYCNTSVVRTDGELQVGVSGDTFRASSSGVSALGVLQPVIFVQSATPTAKKTGDLWFW